VSLTHFETGALALSPSRPSIVTLHADSPRLGDHQQHCQLQIRLAAVDHGGATVVRIGSAMNPIEAIDGTGGETPAASLDGSRP
jgi:hypothetical protein